MVDGNASRVEFEIDHLAFATVEGQFGGLSGTVEINRENLAQSRLKVCLEAATVETGNDRRDRHLRGADFFEVEAHPQICFESEDLFEREGALYARGTLYMVGKKKELTVKLNYDNQQLQTTFTVNRRNWKIGESYPSFTIGEEVEIEVVLVIESLVDSP